MLMNMLRLRLRLDGDLGWMGVEAAQLVTTLACRLRLRIDEWLDQCQ